MANGESLMVLCKNCKSYLVYCPSEAREAAFVVEAKNPKEAFVKYLVKTYASGDKEEKECHDSVVEEMKKDDDYFYDVINHRAQIGDYVVQEVDPKSKSFLIGTTAGRGKYK